MDGEDDEELLLAMALSASEAEAAAAAERARRANAGARAGASPTAPALQRAHGEDWWERGGGQRWQEEEEARRRRAEQTAYEEFEAEQRAQYAFFEEQRAQQQRFQAADERAHATSVYEPSEHAYAHARSRSPSPPPAPPPSAEGQAQAAVAFVTCCVRENEELCDGYYELWGFDEDAIGTSRLPSLQALEAMRADAPPHAPSSFEAFYADTREVVYVDRGRDAALAALCEYVAEEMAPYAGVDERGRAAALAVIVANQMDGVSPKKRRQPNSKSAAAFEANAADERWREVSARLRCERGSLALPLGDITEAGLPRYRALLFKVLAPLAGLHVRLVRGAFYCGDELSARALVMLGEEPLEVDLAREVGALRSDDAHASPHTREGSMDDDARVGSAAEAKEDGLAEQRLLRQLDALGCLAQGLSAEQALRALRMCDGNASRALAACQVMDVTGVGALDAASWLEACRWDVDVTIEAFIGGRQTVLEPGVSKGGDAPDTPTGARGEDDEESLASRAPNESTARHASEEQRGRAPADAAAAHARARARGSSPTPEPYRWEEELYEGGYESYESPGKGSRAHANDAQAGSNARGPQDDHDRPDCQSRRNARPASSASAVSSAQSNARERASERGDEGKGERGTPDRFERRRQEAAAVASAAASEAAQRENLRADVAARVAEKGGHLDLPGVLSAFGFAPAGDSAAQVRSAYRRAALRLHPDRTRSAPLARQVECEEMFKLIQAKLEANSG